MAREFSLINREMPYILRTTEEFRAQIVLFRVEPSDIFIKLNIRDYFVSGKIMDLHDACLRGFESGPRRALLSDVLFFLLFNQFVSTPFEAGRVWRQQVGSGMGLPHSGELMDRAFSNSGERSLVAMMAAYGVRGYWRYKDDILILATRGPLAWSFVRRLKELCSFFCLKVEDFDYFRIDYLDVHVCGDRQFYGTTPILKPTSLSRPLGEDSLHAPHIHQTWPIQFLRNALTRCTSYVDSIQVRQVVLHRFRSYGGSVGLLRSLEQVEVQRVQRPKSLADTRPVYWITFPYHPAWAKELARAVALFNGDMAYQSLFHTCKGYAPRVKIAWCNHGASIGQILSRVGWQGHEEAKSV